jgi:hypothetical protein
LGIAGEKFNAWKIEELYSAIKSKHCLNGPGQFEMQSSLGRISAIESFEVPAKLSKVNKLSPINSKNALGHYCKKNEYSE